MYLYAYISEFKISVGVHKLEFSSLGQFHNLFHDMKNVDGYHQEVCA